ncbi:MAG: tetratricopeptide repeat protein [Gemmatimonadetes bacterium]|nr:tetratricopeptide repeat protein [Gemmatimonadota bacterium]
MFLEWVFEFTPGGLRRTTEPTPGELSAILKAPASKRWPSGLLALGGMTIFLAGAWYVGRQSVTVTGTPAGPGAIEGSLPSIAVLPFVNMSSDPEQEFFSDGISEELLNLLAKIPELRVAARTSSFSFKDKNVEIPQIAERLKVAHILQGSVQKVGKQVRITAQLIRAEDGYQVWSERWDRTLDDIFVIQDEIAVDVAEQLAVRLLPDAPRVRETDPEAYALYLRARHLGLRRTAESLEQSNALLERVLADEPGYAAAWAGLAANYSSQAKNGLGPIEGGFALARAAANRALEIDPEDGLAHAVLGGIAQDYDNDLASAARHFERALELEPGNPDIINDAAVLARYLDRLDEAVALQELAINRDPLTPTGHARLGINYLWAGRLDDAIASLRTALSLSPAFIGAHYNIGMALLMKGDPEAALLAFQKEEGDEEYLIKGEALAFHALGRQAEFEEAFEELKTNWGEQWPSEVAHVYAWIGDADAAFEWLDRAVAQNEDGLTQQFPQPFFAPIRDDPRWQRFREQTGTSAAQLSTIRFKVSVLG